MTLTISFYECEHDGDLEDYVDDVVESGGKIVSSEINEEAEIGRVTVEVEDREAFFEKFKKTDAYCFIN